MNYQRGGTFLGLIIGLLIGLGLALAVAIYVTKVPIPFVNKGQIRSTEQDAAEAKKNKDWDPNAPLYGKNPARAAASAPVAAEPTAAASAAGKAAVVPLEAKPDTKASSSADPLGDLAKARSSGAGIDPFSYFVQVGAYRVADDAEAQRAKLSLAGLEAKVSEREQSGRTIFRVRVGPMDKKDDADKVKEKLEALGMEAALVRVQR
ncbi:MAG: SPOR domain-containing protein [Rhodoferax sp.]|nr:SPOR domain-containing protein [Rhodoferax sp.]